MHVPDHDECSSAVARRLLPRLRTASAARAPPTASAGLRLPTRRLEPAERTRHHPRRHTVHRCTPHQPSGLSVSFRGRVAQLGVELFEAKGGMVKGKLFVVGGVTNGWSCTTLPRRRLPTPVGQHVHVGKERLHAWTGQPAPRRRHHAGVGASRGALATPSATSFRSTQTWMSGSQLPSLPQKRGAGRRSCWTRRCAYVVDGASVQNGHANMWVLDLGRTHSQGWKGLASTSEGRNHGATSNSKIYAVRRTWRTCGRHDRMTSRALVFIAIDVCPCAAHPCCPLTACVRPW